MNIRFLTFSLMLCVTLHAAGPVVHALCAELYFKHVKPTYTPAERDAFMRGTLFPDIRYIGHISREKTHAKDVTLDQVKNASSPFHAGMLFHAYVDEQREIIARHDKIYEHLSEIPKRKALFLKMIEDELCYHLLDRAQIRHALIRYDAEEQDYGVNFIKRIAWHRVQRSYFKQSPLMLLENKVASHKGYFSIPYDELAQALPLFKKYQEDDKVNAYMSHFLSAFENLLRS